MTVALPTIGRIVIYRHPLPKGSYDVPAVVSATSETLQQARDAGLDTRHVRELTGDDHLHLTVFSPLVTCPDGVEHARDVPPVMEGEEKPAAGTWRWPERPEISDAEVRNISVKQVMHMSNSAGRRL